MRYVSFLAIPFMLASCIPITTTPDGQIIPLEQEPRIQINDATQAFMMDTHRRMVGNRTLPDVELVLKRGYSKVKL